MDQFLFYLEFGFTHILDIAGYDHMLFLLALCALYRLKDWKRVLILVTAFTIGHSVTLAAAALDIIQISSELIEFLIAFTIFLTAVYNLTLARNEELSRGQVQINYAMALIFGFIHGMGFSNQFKALLGQEESIVPILFPFNLGIELGQILFVIGIMLFGGFLVEKLKLPFKYWKFSLSIIAGLLALYMMSQRIFW
ncbi:MAG: HupE/UreJ family protein [Bacteroidia bacterium]|nr:HupE/UreJ family protein [Bacteroidia bacterium]